MDQKETVKTFIMTVPDKEIRDLVENTFFNFLMGIDPNGIEISFNNDCYYGNKTIKPDVKNLQQLIEHGVNVTREKLLGCLCELHQLGELIEIDDNKLEETIGEFELDDGDWCDTVGEYIRNHGYELINGILPSRYAFGGDSNGSLFFESSAEDFFQNKIVEYIRHVKKDENLKNNN